MYTTDKNHFKISDFLTLHNKDLVTDSDKDILQCS